MDLAAAAEPGWSEPFGGPRGVALLAPALQEAALAEIGSISRVRSMAIRELLNTHSLAEVAKMLGISKQAVSQAAKQNRIKGWFQW